MTAGSTAQRGCLRACSCVLVGAALLALAGCSQNTAGVGGDGRAIPANVKLVLADKIKIQPWTQPVSFSAGTDADGLEVLLAAHDGFGDETKAVGMLHLELYTRRATSTDRLGERVAFWPIDLNSHDMQMRYWDRQVRFYRLPVKLPSPPLAPGQYILTAQLQVGPEDRLFDEYEFTYAAGTAAPAKFKP